MNRKKFLACLVGLPFIGKLFASRPTDEELRQAADWARNRVSARRNHSNEQIEVEWSVWCNGEEIWRGAGFIDANPVSGPIIPLEETSL